MKEFPWGHQRRFNAASNAIRKKFGGRIQKVTLDAGFTCPNRDGTKSTGGCSFCNNNAFNPSYCHPEKSIAQQIQEGIEFHETRYKAAGSYFAYFQAYSNTYANVDLLDKLYREALEEPKIIGLIIGTRPDCVDGPIFDLLEELSQDKHIVVEFGIESVYDETLEKINRGHGFEESKWAVQEAAKRGLSPGGHIIFGLPGESRQMMYDSAKVLSELPLHSLKFHQLQIIKGTALGEGYQEDASQFELFELEEYVEFMANYLELLNPNIIIERLAGETQPRHNLGIMWGLRYDQVLQKIENELQKRDSWQGKKYQ